MGKNRRRILLINPAFQLRFAFYVCSWQLGLTLVYPLIITNLFDAFVRYLAIDPNGPVLSHLQEVQTQILWILVLLQVVVIGIMAFISIFISHKIAGPLFKLNRFFLESSPASPPPKLTFRSKDYFQELAGGFNIMWEKIRAGFGNDAKQVKSAMAHLEIARQTQDLNSRHQIEMALSILKEIEKS